MWVIPNAIKFMVDIYIYSSWMFMAYKLTYNDVGYNGVMWVKQCH